MRFHCVIILLETRRVARRDQFGNCGPPQACLGSIRRDEKQENRDKGGRCPGNGLRGVVPRREPTSPQ